MRYIFLSLILLFFVLTGCITQFTPPTAENKKMLVVEALITDKPDISFVKLSKSSPLGIKSSAEPLTGCHVRVTDDTGLTIYFSETQPGLYKVNDSFQGTEGRFYTLHISDASGANSILEYESTPMELRLSPPIDSIYYEKVLIESSPIGLPAKEGVNIFIDTHDPENKCKYYRWEYEETWEFHLPYTVPNSRCWVTENSGLINIKNASVLAENRVDRFNINYVSNESDRLSQRYSILVHQFAVSENEYSYWEKLQNVSEQVGGLYDIIPASIASNVYCTNDPDEKVLGYFSVSGSSSKRLFIDENFAGIYNPYSSTFCIQDTVFGGEEIPSLNTFVWVIIDHPLPPPSYRVTTREKGCYDCTVRGTKIEPEFWHENKSTVIDENKINDKKN